MIIKDNVAIPEDVQLSLICTFYPRRPLDANKVKAIALSVEGEGLKYAITLYRLRGMLGGKYGLAAGSHRYAAFELLGRKTIPAYIVSKAEAERWASEENILRNELGALDLSAEIVRFSDSHKSERASRTQPHDLGHSWLAGRLGHTRKRVAEAFLHQNLNERTVQLLRQYNLDTNCSLLTKLSRLVSADDQVKALMKKVAGKKHEPPSELDQENRELEDLKALWCTELFSERYGAASLLAKTQFIDFIRPR